MFEDNCTAESRFVPFALILLSLSVLAAVYICIQKTSLHGKCLKQGNWFIVFVL